jgi:hypothetical protein
METSKYIKATDIKEELNIKPGHKIKLYGKETTVEGFYPTYNDALERWETIMLTDGRGDPFERSLDVIEVLMEQPTEQPTIPQQGDRCPECGAPCKIIEKTYQEEIHDVHYVEHQYAPQQGAVTTVFVPCREDDPRSCGAYQSHCGRSLAYVRESQVPVVESGAGWVKASERLPGWGQYVRWRHESGKELPGKESVHSMTDTSPVSLHGFEWLDEGGEKEVTNG